MNKDSRFGLTPEETKGLLLSVGQRGMRTLSPVEVGRLFEKMRKNGASKKDCARLVHLEGEDMIDKYCRLKNLPEDLVQDVGFREQNSKLVFSVATEIARLANKKCFPQLDNEREMQELVSLGLAGHLTGPKTREILQLRQKNFHQSLQESVEQVVKSRKKSMERRIAVGQIMGQALRESLKELTQLERDKRGDIALRNLNILNLSGVSVGTKKFTLIADGAAIQTIDRLPENFETIFSEQLNGDD
tara:strand:+ start:1450 stop:2187 length:738 start_codon:yes stop_codon:yes gene_type:complete